DEAVVFIVGMRVNRWLKLRSWWPVFAAMPRMLAYLEKTPESGFLGGRKYWSGRVVLGVQYWRSMEDLGRFARDPKLLHHPAWAAFNRKTAGTADVGVFHETYVVRKGDIETLYGNMPAFGLAAAHRAVPRSMHGPTAAMERMGTQDPEYVS